MRIEAALIVLIAGVEMPFFHLQDREVLLAIEDGFLSTYLSSAFTTWGIEVGTIVRSAGDLDVRIDGIAKPVAACVSVNLPGLDASAGARLAAGGIPFLLIGIPNSPSALAASVGLLWPFSAFQLATDLAALVEKGSLASGRPLS